MSLRHSLLGAIRSFFASRGYLEVETPLAVVSPGIDAHIDALGIDGGLYLSTSPEFHMKRLLAGDSGPIFQITRSFRAGEKGHRHRSEFTMLEWYAAGWDYRRMMDETEDLVLSAAAALSGACGAAAGRWARPFHRLAVDEAFRRYAGWEPSESFESDRFFLDLVEKVEPSLGGLGAVFLYDYPAPAASLSRLSPDRPSLAERFELYLDGLEICNGFSELTDAGEQRRRFESANRERADLGKKPYPLDEDFLDALEKGLPPCAGNALGVDRLLMALTGAPDIADVLPFPPLSEKKWGQA